MLFLSAKKFKMLYDPVIIKDVSFDFIYSPNYIRLNNASKTYPTPDAFENSSHISTAYVKGGETLMILVLVLGVGILFLAGSSSINC